MTGRSLRALANAALIAATIAGCATRPSDEPQRAAPAGVPAARMTPERVTFDSLDRDPATGAPVRIAGLLYLPTAPAARRPAVVALHGCGGLYSALASRRDFLTVRHRVMAELLAEEGYVVLLPDSFRPRGQEEICTIEARLRTITQVHRLRDAQGALAYLQQRADVAPDRIAVLGWSHGGSAVLVAENAKLPTVARWKDRPGAPPYFRAGVAFYPGCVDSLRARAGYTVAAPLTLFVGAVDDWTAPEPCIDLAARLAAAGEPVTITVYPDTYHGFDNPAAQGRLRLEVPNGVHPGAGVTVAPNPAARDDAYAKLKRFLRTEIGGP
jgi:dienelactone hydrolase